MTKKFYTILAVAAAVFLLADTAFLVWYLTDRHERILFGKDRPLAGIYIEPDDTATRAAANYLADEVSQKLGYDPEIVAVREDGKQYISILCGEGVPASAEADAEPASGNRAEIVVTAAAAPVAAEEADPDYSVILEEDAVAISVSLRENCFGAVKAVADRWLQNDCGLKTAGELRISRPMIREQLSGLPVGVEGTFRVLSQNLRYTDDPEGSVEERAERFVKLVADTQPDVIGTQECTYEWLQLLREKLSGEYEFFGCSRLGPDSEKEEWNAILFRKARFAFSAGDTFWLSNTPATPATKLNYDGCFRICTWVLLRDLETGKTVLFSNTHLQDGFSELFKSVRERQVEVLFRQLRKGSNKLAQYPGFLTGDFNGEKSDGFYPAVTAVYQDAETTAISRTGRVDYSYHAYGRVKSLIDFCFHSPKNTTILDYRIVDDDYDGYVSDHYGVLVTALVNG